MFSHSDGEVWGLDVSDYPKVCTSADDNKVIVWDTEAHKKIICHKLTDRKEGKGRGKQNGASTLSDLPASQCSRAVVCRDGVIHAAGNDGKVTFNLGTDVETVVQVGDEWIECMVYSPDGRYLAIGSHDNRIYIF